MAEECAANTSLHLIWTAQALEHFLNQMNQSTVWPCFNRSFGARGVEWRSVLQLARIRFRFKFLLPFPHLLYIFFYLLVLFLY